MSEENINFHEFLGALSNLYTAIHAERDELVTERDRLLVIAAKHCPRDHADWLDIMRMMADA